MESTFKLKRVLPAGDKFKNTVDEKGLVKEGVTTIVYQYVMQLDTPTVENQIMMEGQLH